MICIDRNKPKVPDQFFRELLFYKNSIKDKVFELENSEGDNSFTEQCSMKKPPGENLPG